MSIEKGDSGEDEDDQMTDNYYDEYEDIKRSSEQNVEGFEWKAFRSDNSFFLGRDENLSGFDCISDSARIN